MKGWDFFFLGGGGEGFRGKDNIKMFLEKYHRILRTRLVCLRIGTHGWLVSLCVSSVMNSRVPRNDRNF